MTSPIACSSAFPGPAPAPRHLRATRFSLSLSLPAHAIQDPLQRVLIVNSPNAAWHVVKTASGDTCIMTMDELAFVASRCSKGFKLSAGERKLAQEKGARPPPPPAPCDDLDVAKFELFSHALGTMTSPTRGEDEDDSAYVPSSISGSSGSSDSEEDAMDLDAPLPPPASAPAAAPQKRPASHITSDGEVAAAAAAAPTPSKRARHEGPSVAEALASKEAALALESNTTIIGRHVLEVYQAYHERKRMDVPLRPAGDIPCDLQGPVIYLQHGAPEYSAVKHVEEVRRTALELVRDALGKVARRELPLTSLNEIVLRMKDVRHRLLETRVEDALRRVAIASNPLGLPRIALNGVLKMQHDDSHVLGRTPHPRYMDTLAYESRYRTCIGCTEAVVPFQRFNLAMEADACPDCQTNICSMCRFNKAAAGARSLREMDDAVRRCDEGKCICPPPPPTTTLPTLPPLPPLHPQEEVERGTIAGSVPFYTGLPEAPVQEELERATTNAQHHAFGLPYPMEEWFVDDL